MIIAVDFDGVIAREDRPYDDVTTPLGFVDGTKIGLRALKNAGHVLILWSARNSPAHCFPWFSPLIRSGVAHDASTDATRELHANRWRQMIDFVEHELPGVFDAIDDGYAGKVHADLYIDNRSVAFGRDGVGWAQIASLYGE
jgi:hypothetical protein